MEELQEREWRRLVETIHRGNCVLVLGPDVVFDPADADCRSLTSRLTEHLAKRLPDPPRHSCELPLVAQLYLQQPKLDRYDLEIDVVDFYRPYSGQTSEFHRLLSALPFSLCVTTTPDGFMTNALRDKEDKRPQSAFYDFSDPGRPALLTAADADHPIVYGLFGDLSKPSSLVLSEIELLDFLITVVRGDSGLPDFIAAQLTAPQTAFLFIGFGFQRWYARILLHVLQTEGPRSTRSLAMEGDAFFTHPEGELTALFFEQACSIAFRQQGWVDFAADLRRRFEQTFPLKQPPAELPEDAPKVFLRHDSRDSYRVAALGRRLHTLGVNTWRDRQDLRGGDGWDRRIRQVIHKQVDYVLVCETPNLIGKGESYLHLEIKESLDRQKQFPSDAKFLIPAMLEPCEVLTDLEHLHRADLTQDAGVQRLAESILEDWRLRQSRRHRPATDPHMAPGPDPSTVGPMRDRYPGARSFHDDSVDARLFFGRKTEIELLTHRVRATRLLLLFGKSGLGKTSLLQAGLFPVLRQEHAMLPVSLRFNRSDPPLQPAELVDLVIDRFVEVARERGVDCEPGERNSLWEFFKTTDFWRDDTLLRPVLVLDQFEEVFTLQGAPFREALAGQLKDLARRGLPDVVRRQRDDGNRLDYGTSQPDLGVILSFREEYLAELEELVADVPGLLEHRFRLAPLIRERAEEAVVEPAGVPDGSVFRARPFSYDEETLRSILDFLSNEAGEVEPFQLQVLCSHIERSVVAAQSAVATAEETVRVDDSLLGGRKAMLAVLSRFYVDALKRVRRRRQRRRARRLCERGLLSPAGNRVSAEESTIERGYKVKRDTLEQLIDARLLRKDTRPGLKGFYYELSHDSLTEPVQAGLRRSRKRRNLLIAARAILVVTQVTWVVGRWGAATAVRADRKAGSDRTGADHPQRDGSV